MEGKGGHSPPWGGLTRLRVKARVSEGRYGGVKKPVRERPKREKSRVKKGGLLIARNKGVEEKRGMHTDLR